MSNEITKPVNTFLTTVKEYSLTPCPPIVFASSLYLTPFLQSPAVSVPQPQLQQQAARTIVSRISPFGSSKTTVKAANPTTLSSLLFGSFIGLGSFMIYDNDLINGSGVVSAWSILFSIVHFRRGLLSLSLWPKWLVGLGIFNGYMYGRTFILGTKKQEIV